MSDTEKPQPIVFYTNDTAKMAMPGEVVEGQRIRIEALEGAAKALATRTVLAEAAAEVAQREIAALREQRKESQEKAVGDEWRFRRLWVCFWYRQGFGTDRIATAIANHHKHWLMTLLEAKEFINGCLTDIYELDKEHGYKEDESLWAKKERAARDALGR